MCEERVWAQAFTDPKHTTATHAHTTITHSRTHDAPDADEALEAREVVLKEIAHSIAVEMCNAV